MKYAPALADGRKPWVRSVSEFSGHHEYESILYAGSAGEVKNAYRRMLYETVTVRRATVDDLARLDVDPNYAPEGTTA